MRVTRASIGDTSPIMAIDDELREHPANYDAIIICTFPVGVSRWLKLDLPTQAQQAFKLPVVHVVAQPIPVGQAARPQGR